MVESREPFWATVERDGRRFRVYFLTDRGGIYALGYPVVTWFGHFVNLAELMVLTGVLYVVLLVLATLFSVVVSQRASQRPCAPPRDSIQLLPQAVPDVRGRRHRPGVHPRASPSARYFAAQLLAGADRSGGADRDDGAAPGRGLRGSIQPRGRRPWRGHRSDHGARRRGPSTRTPTCSNAHAFRRRARATSSRRSCSRRGHLRRVYRRILLDRLPTFVGDDARRRGRAIGWRPHRAAPADATASSPCRVTNRQREIDQRIDELDRQVLLGDRAVQPAGRGDRLLDGRADRRSRQPADARDPADRPRRPRRAESPRRRATSCGAWSRTSTRWRPT